MIRAVLFDFDLTLADSIEGTYACANYALKAIGLESVSRETVAALIGFPLPEMFYRLSGNSNAERAARFMSLFREAGDLGLMAAGITFFPQVGKVLSELKKKNLLTGIVSAKLRYRIEQLLVRDNLTHLFDLIIGGEDIPLTI